MPRRTNFIPERAQQRGAAARGLRLVRVATPLVALLVCVPMVLVQELSARRAAALLYAEQQRDALAGTVAELTWRRAETKRLAPARDVVRAAHTNVAAWTDVLRDLRDRAPDGLWLTRLDLVPHLTKGLPQTVALGGQAQNAGVIGAYLEALNRSAWLAHANLVASHPAPVATPPTGGPSLPPAPSTANLINFELRAVLRRPIAEGTP